MSTDSIRASDPVPRKGPPRAIAFVVLVPITFWIILAFNPLEVQQGSSLIIQIVRAVTYTVIVPLFFGLWLYRDLSSDLKLLLLLIGTAVLIDVLSSWLSHLHENTYWLFIIYTFLEFGLLMLIFTSWQKRKSVKKLMNILLPVVIGIMLLEKWQFGWQTDALDSNAVILEGITLVAFAAFALIDITGENILFVFNNPRFWIVTGVIFNFSGNLLIVALWRFIILQTPEAGEATLQISIYILYQFLNLLMNTCYTISFLCLTRIGSK